MKSTRRSYSLRPREEPTKVHWVQAAKDSEIVLPRGYLVGVLFLYLLLVGIILSQFPGTPKLVPEPPTSNLTGDLDGRP